MHLTWALLIAWNARSLISLWLYAVIIAIATPALRERYLDDLLAAVPYHRSAMVRRAFRSSFSTRRRNPPILHLRLHEVPVDPLLRETPVLERERALERPKRQERNDRARK